MHSLALTIYNQIGTEALAMLGASRFVQFGNGLRFDFKGCKKYNKIQISLDDNDTYTLMFVNVRGFSIESDSISGVQAESLLETIELRTGLYTSLEPRGSR